MSRHTLILFFSLSISAQEIPNQFFEFTRSKVLSGMPFSWEQNTTFGPSRYRHIYEKSDSLKTSVRFGAFLKDNQKMIYGYGHFTYNKYFHGYLFPRIVNNPYTIQGYSGISRDIARAGFSSGETDQSGITYENGWIILQFGRGRQSWGAGQDIQLAISEKSNSYDYGMLDLDFEKLRVRYFHGYLESDSMMNNRYITGRGIEWNNNKNLLLGISEVIIYSGVNRPIDFSYMNPISTHLEIELNDRQNSQGTDSGNGVWQLSMDYLFFSKLRFSFNYLIDEFILDGQQKENGKGNGRAYSFKAEYSPSKNINSFIKFYFSIIGVGTNTFRHEEGQNNFVHRNSPLGWQVGSDSREIKIGFDFLYKEKLMVDLDIGHKDLGEKNFIDSLYEPYTSYSDKLFPSGEVESINFTFSKAQYWWRPNISTFIQIEHNNSNKLGENFEWNIGFDIYYGVNKYL